jgi:very-short-patch-repair endonuclease
VETRAHTPGIWRSAPWPYRYDPAFTRSRAERRFLDLCLEHRLPRPRTCFSIAGHEVDTYWPDARLAIEFDGEALPSHEARVPRGRRRDRRLATLGVQVNRVTWPDLHDGAGLAAELRAIIAQRLPMPRAAS